MRPATPIALILGAWLGVMPLQGLALSPSGSPAESPTRSPPGPTSSARTSPTPEAGTQAGQRTRVYRCAQADGSTLYAQHPCPAATKADRVMHIGDHRTADQAEQGQEIQQRSDRLAKSMQHERKAFERQAKGREAVALTPSREVGRASPSADDDAHDDGARGSRKLRARPDGKGKNKGKTQADPHAPKPLQPAGFTAKVPGSGKKAAKAAPTQSD